MRCFAAILLAVLVAGPASAVSFLSAPSLAISDDDPGSPAIDTIDTATTFTPDFVITSISVEVSIDHTWVGDLAIVLRSPGGVELQLLARPGATQPDEGQGFPWGSGADLVAANPILFTDAGTASAETLGSTGSPIPAGSFRADADGWSTDITSFAEYAGDLAGGVWTLEVGDYAGGEVGTLVSWTLDITAVSAIPEPSTASLLCLGLVVLAARRRR